MSDTALDAVSSATLSAGTQTFTWDLTDSTGNYVPDGIYNVKVEGTLYWSSNALYTAQIDTTKAISGNIEVLETRSEPDNGENQTMLGNVKVTALSDDENTGDVEDGILGNTLSWSYDRTSRDITIAGNMDENEYVFIASYESGGKFIDISSYDGYGKAVAVARKAEKVKLFCLDSAFVPKWPNVDVRTA